MRCDPKLGHRVLLCAVFGVCLLLAGCAGSARTPMVAIPQITSICSPTPTMPTMTATMMPGATPTTPPTLADPLRPSSTAPPTSTPTPSSTSTSVPTSTVSPAYLPNTQLQEAMRHQTNGNYEEAIAGYLHLLEGDLMQAQACEARYQLARSYALSRNYAAAAAAWQDYFAQCPEDSNQPEATLMLARAYDAAGECARAIRHYEDYVAQYPLLADMVYRWIGDCRALDADLDGAIAAYRQALEAASAREIQVSLREKIAAAYLAQEDYDAALSEYNAILAVARVGQYRARIDYLAGQALAAKGLSEAAHARYRRAVDNYPEAEYAYLSLIQLLDAGVEVDEFQRGLVDYHAGKYYAEAYGAAIRAFDRFLSTAPGDKAEEALYYKALAQRAMGETSVALETLDALISGQPDRTWLVRALWERAATQAELDDSAGAIETYRALAANFPAEDLAPQALMEAASLEAKAGAFPAAATLYEGVGISFPGSKDADAAAWQAGLAHYRAGNLEEAVANWQRLLAQYPESSYRLASLYWLGKVSALLGVPEAQDHWDQLVAADPGAYYALRVQQIQSGESLTVTRLVTAPVEAVHLDLDLAERELLGWLRDWAQSSAGTRLIPVSASVSSHRDFLRGAALLAAGLRTEALEAYDSVRAAVWDDPHALAELALFFHSSGLHGMAARSALRLAALWPDGGIDNAPAALRRLAYPYVYADLLSAEAQAYGLDPMLLAALVRQESLFEPMATSYAGARGLGQVMPATGEGIARSLGLADFALDDLYRPSVSIRFGAYYLAAQMKRFDNQILIALAAYNGGPGNTLGWLEAAGDDLDLFVETITASQSRRYLQQVYEQYYTYEKLYRITAEEEH